MSVWWDTDTQKYRSTLVHKVFYVWGWPVLRWTLFRCVSGEQAHWLAIHVGIRLVDRIERIWTWSIVFPAAVVFLIVLRLLLFIPGFYMSRPNTTEKGK